MDNQGGIINIMKNMNDDWEKRTPHLTGAKWTFFRLSEFLFKEEDSAFYHMWE